MDVSELWACWDTGLSVPICFCCEDCPATGSLILVDDDGEPLPSSAGLPICCRCEPGAQGIQSPTNLGHWIYVPFEGD